ncbi:MAG: thioredoxin, partial [Anaerolineales bacterium]|nr:thioredoxin [Anaerolineales bacterium]
MEEIMSDVLEITGDTFQAEVIDQSQPVLVDFSAVWCGPCKMLKPVVDELAKEWGDSVKVVELDVDYAPEIAIKYQVMGVPTLMLFVDGEAKERITGFQPKDRISSKLSPHLAVA